MKKALFAQMGGTYREVNGYLIPNLTLSAEERQHIGIWGQLHLQYIRQYKQVFYTELLMSSKLNSYLADIDKQAEEMFSRLMDQMAERESITEKLKGENQMLWVGKMNAIHEAAMEIANNDLIYT